MLSSVLRPVMGFHKVTKILFFQHQPIPQIRLKIEACKMIVLCKVISQINGDQPTILNAIYYLSHATKIKQSDGNMTILTHSNCM